jgi:integrase
MTTTTDRPKRKMLRTQTPGVYKVGSRYCIVWRHRGKQHKQSFRTLSEAREAKALRVRDSRPPARTPFDRYAEGWIDTYSGRTVRGLRESTRIFYRRWLGHLTAHVGSARLDEIGARDVRACLAALERSGVSPAGVRAARRVLSALMATCAEDGLIAVNPVTGVRFVPSRPVTTEEEQAEREATALLREIGADEDRLLVSFLLATGLRIGELVGLTWADLDLGAHPRVQVRSQIYRGERVPLKTATSRRDVPLSDAMADTLRAKRRDGYRGPHAPVFASSVGTPRNPSAIAGRVVKPAARAIGLPWVSCHTFRRTCGAWLLAEGRTVVQVQRWLGHSDPSTTLRSYVGLTDEGVGPGLDVAALNFRATEHPQDDAGRAPELAA